MRDCRTKAETPLHRAAAFGTEETIQLLLDAGARVDAKDMNGDSPLTWASWHLRPDSILGDSATVNSRFTPHVTPRTTTGRGGESWESGKPHMPRNGSA